MKLTNEQYFVLLASGKLDRLLLKKLSGASCNSLIACQALYGASGFTVRPARLKVGMRHGFVKLWRSSLDTDIWKNVKAWRVFEWCLLNAKYKEESDVLGDQAIVLQPGQLVATNSTIAKECGLSLRNVRTAMSLLGHESVMKLTCKTTNKGTVITVCNWATYQSEENQNDTPTDKQTTNKRQTNDTPYNKEKKERSKETTPPTPQGAGSVCDFEMQFDPVTASVLEAWQQQRERRGLAFVADKKTRQAAGEAARLLHGNSLTLEQLKTAMGNLLADPEARERYTLRGLVNNVSQWLKPRAAPSKAPASRQDPKRNFSGRCSCGQEMSKAMQISSSEITEKCQKCGNWVDLRRELPATESAKA